jgi:hypothetical protein
MVKRRALLGHSGAGTWRPWLRRPAAAVVAAEEEEEEEEAVE